MIAPPWLRMPPSGYGGIEYVVHHLVGELRRMGVQVTLFATGDTTTHADARHALFDEGQYPRIATPLYESVGIPLAHAAHALAMVQQDPTIDLIHDHTAPIGCLATAVAAGSGLPPALHTLHNAFVSSTVDGKWITDDRPFYENLASLGVGMAVNAISHAQYRTAPHALRSLMAGVVHNGVHVDSFPFELRKEPWFATLARIAPCKGHDVAARVCTRIGAPLRIAGGMAGCSSVAELQAAAIGDVPGVPNCRGDLAHYRDCIMPLLKPGEIEHVGELAGPAKIDLLARARALLLPISWEEPFGLVAIEALACGTPVVAMSRGALPEIVEHGRTGFLADSEDEFAQYALRVGEIDPAECRASVERRFSTHSMALGYLQIYQRMLEGTVRPHRANVVRTPTRAPGVPQPATV